LDMEVRASYSGEDRLSAASPDNDRFAGQSPTRGAHAPCLRAAAYDWCSRSAQFRAARDRPRFCFDGHTGIVKPSLNSKGIPCTAPDPSRQVVTGG